MPDFSIGQAEGITGLKAHILRYWEEIIPLIRPRKDNQGRRFYSTRDLELILRVKYLVYQKKYTLEGAGEQLIKELSSNSNQNALHELNQIQNELMHLYSIVKRDPHEGD